MEILSSHRACARQVLIPTYMHCPPEEFEAAPYLATRLRPLLPVIIPGVSANKWIGEWKKPHQALMQWWKAPHSSAEGSLMCALLFLFRGCSVPFALPSRIHCAMTQRAFRPAECILHAPGVLFRFGSLPSTAPCRT